MRKTASTAALVVCTMTLGAGPGFPCCHVRPSEASCRSRGTTRRERGCATARLRRARQGVWTSGEATPHARTCNRSCIRLGLETPRPSATFLTRPAQIVRVHCPTASGCATAGTRNVTAASPTMLRVPTQCSAGIRTLRPQRRGQGPRQGLQESHNLRRRPHARVLPRLNPLLVRQRLGPRHEEVPGLPACDRRCGYVFRRFRREVWDNGRIKSGCGWARTVWPPVELCPRVCDPSHVPNPKCPPARSIRAGSS